MFDLAATLLLVSFPSKEKFPAKRLSLIIATFKPFYAGRTNYLSASSLSTTRRLTAQLVVYL